MTENAYGTAIPSSVSQTSDHAQAVIDSAILVWEQMEHREESRIGHPAQEMHPAEVERVPDLLQHLFPIGLTFRKSRPIAHLIADTDAEIVQT